MKTERRWKDIPGYEKLYAISDYGEVYSYRRKIIRKNHRGHGGPSIKLMNEGISEYFMIDRLVAEAFLGKKHDCIVRHIDGDTENNYYKNLYWRDDDTYSDKYLKWCFKHNVNPKNSSSKFINRHVEELWF